MDIVKTSVSFMSSITMRETAIPLKLGARSIGLETAIAMQFATRNGSISTVEIVSVKVIGLETAIAMQFVTRKCSSSTVEIVSVKAIGLEMANAIIRATTKNLIGTQAIAPSNRAK